MALVGSSRCGRCARVHTRSSTSGSDAADAVYPYSPSTQHSTRISTGGRSSLDASLMYASTASRRSASSASSSSSPDPSASSRIRFSATSSLTSSPPSSNTVVMVPMNHALLGANRSASCVMRVTRSSRRKESVLPRRKVVSLSAITSTLAGLVIWYSSSSVLRFSVSSDDSRQSITASWWSAAYCGWSFTMAASPVTPRYLRLWLSDVMKRLMAAAAASSSVGFG
mmetsp:Transcript_5620/g.17930  ORF Transcript_5620/g.17930 Transcript_5620/m.17930 type:complete len:226 (+) Transcript_5620:1114-1791(+)